MDDAAFEVWLLTIARLDAAQRPWGQAGGKPRYPCAECRKTFNPLTGTPLSGLHYPDRWRDRVLAALNLDQPQRLSGIVAADETFLLESFSGKRGRGKRGKLPRAARQRGGKAMRLRAPPLPRPRPRQLAELPQWAPNHRGAVKRLIPDAWIMGAAGLGPYQQSPT